VIGTNGDGLMRFRTVRSRIYEGGWPAKQCSHDRTLKTRRQPLGGQYCGGLSVFNGQRFKTYDQRTACPTRVCGYWPKVKAANSGRNLGRWAFRFGMVTLCSSPHRKGLPDNVVRAITVAHDGSLWIATGNGLSHMVTGSSITTRQPTACIAIVC